MILASLLTQILYRRSSEMRFFTMDSEGDGLVDEITKFHCIVFKEYKKENIFVFVDKERMTKDISKGIENVFSKYRFTWGYIEDFPRFLKSDIVDGFHCHNFFGFDQKAIEKLIPEIKFNPFIRREGVPSTVNVGGFERDIHIYDTLPMSRTLHPDRPLPSGCPARIKNPITGKMQNVGPHGFQAWGYRVARAKPQIDDWINDTLFNYIQRCVADTEIGEKVWDALRVEAQDIATGGDWKKPLKTSMIDFFLFCGQEQEGALLDKEKAKTLWESINKMMKEIADDVNAYLLEKNVRRPLPKTKQPKYPAQTFKKDGTLTNNALKWCDRVGIPEKDAEKAILCINKALKEGDESVLERYVLTEQVTIAHDAAIKEYLVEEGWVPTLWNIKNAFVNQKKKDYTPEEVDANIAKYISELKTSPYKRFILKELDWEGMDTDRALSTESFRKHVKSKGRQLPTTPKIKDAATGRICHNLEEMDGDFAKKVVKYGSLENRRNVILSDNGTGWLTHPRLERDGRIPASHTGTTNTHRVKHSNIVNIPKPDPKVLLGYEMRDLFVAPEGWMCVGWDSAALENRVAGSAAYPYDGGRYADILLLADSHTLNAQAYSKAAGKEITRNNGKSVTYGILYGAQAKKVAKMLDISVEKAQDVINAFWDSNDGLKKFKEHLEAYWESTGKKYILGLDGRKVYTRSKHSLVNAAFQSCGAILMSHTMVEIEYRRREQGLIAPRWGFYHDEGQYYIPFTKDKSLFDFVIQDEKDTPKPDDRMWTKAREIKEGKAAGKFVRYYSRFGELCVETHRDVGVMLGMNIPLDGEYMVGKSWAQTH
jgi:hypothetical protein